MAHTHSPSQSNMEALSKVASTDFTKTSDLFIDWFVALTSLLDDTPSFSRCVLSPELRTLPAAEQMSFG